LRCEENQTKLRVDFYGTGIFGRADKYEILNRTPIVNGRQRTKREMAFKLMIFRTPHRAEDTCV
jgi:hypothetical protein